MSPTTDPRPAKRPSRRVSSRCPDTGTTSAMGTPRFVIKTGSPVSRTRSNTARHVALNLEMASFSTR